MHRLRLGLTAIGPNDYSMERYTLNEAPSSFSIDQDSQYLVACVKAAQAVKGDVKFWASPWTPPPWAKTGNTLSRPLPKSSRGSAKH